MLKNVTDLTELKLRLNVKLQFSQIEVKLKLVVLGIYLY